MSDPVISASAVTVNGADERRFFETADGVDATGFFGKVSLKAFSSRRPGLVCVHIRRTRPDGRDWVLHAELDPEMAKIFAAHLHAVARLVEGQ